MNPILARMYGTNGAAAQVDESEKTAANKELFAKLAAQHNIDLSTMSPAQIEEMYSEVFSGQAKTAAATPAAAGPTAEEVAASEIEAQKVAAAEAYFVEKRAFAEDFAKADMMGRVMAHSFTQERGEIEKSAAFPPKKDDDKEDKGKDKEDKDDDKDKGGKPAFLFGKKEEKTAAARAFDEIAANRAIEMAKAAGYDPDMSFKRVEAVYILDLPESTKIASVKDTETGLQVRALEYLEAAGFPVNWAEVK